ncbi:unnamed protein product [Rhizophagus irregularis]|nr:unnamed protein product [Rhizophagus irregularis]
MFDESRDDDDELLTKGQLVTSFIKDLKSNTTSTDFVENLVDEPQVTLQLLLSGIELENIIEIWKICRIDGLLQRENLVALMIPTRWYKDNITNLNCSFENSPVLSAIEPVDTSTSSVPPSQNNFTLQTKTAINVALKIKTDEKLIKILKDFIASKHEKQSERNDYTNNNLEVNNYTEDQSTQNTSNIIIPLQHLIG